MRRLQELLSRDARLVSSAMKRKLTNGISRKLVLLGEELRVETLATLPPCLGGTVSFALS